MNFATWSWGNHSELLGWEILSGENISLPKGLRMTFLDEDGDSLLGWELKSRSSSSKLRTN